MDNEENMYMEYLVFVCKFTEKYKWWLKRGLANENMLYHYRSLLDFDIYSSSLINGHHHVSSYRTRSHGAIQVTLEASRSY